MLPRWEGNQYVSLLSHVFILLFKNQDLKRIDCTAMVSRTYTNFNLNTKFEENIKSPVNRIFTVLLYAVFSKFSGVTKSIRL